MKIELYGEQWRFVNCTDRFSLFVGGIGSGKSYAGAVKALLAGGKAKTMGLVVAPTYPMLRDATLRTFQAVAGNALVDFHKSEMRGTLRNGAEILFRSADMPDRLRGPNIHWMWIDEAALCPAQTWEVGIGRLRADGTAGPAWLTTTPKGRNWVYNQLSNLTVFRSTTADNPYLDREFVHSLESVYTGQFARQELYGDFVTFEGLVYDEFDRSRHVMEQDQREGWRYVAGIDEGYTNPSVIMVVGLDSDNRVHIAQEMYRRRMLQGDVIAEARRLRDAFQIDTFYADPSAAGLIAELRDAGLPVVAADHRVMDGIHRVKAALQVAGDGRPRLTVSPQCVNTIAEFESYVWKEGRAGMRDEPEKVNDHAMDALRYILNSATFQAVYTVENPFYA